MEIRKKIIFIKANLVINSFAFYKFIKEINISQKF